MNKGKLLAYSTLMLMLMLITAAIFAFARHLSSETEIEKGEVKSDSLSIIAARELQSDPALVDKVVIEIRSINKYTITLDLVNNSDSEISFSQSYLDYYCIKDGKWMEAQPAWRPTLLTPPPLEVGGRMLMRIHFSRYYPFALMSGNLYRVRVPVWTNPRDASWFFHDVVYEFYWDFD